MASLLNNASLLFNPAGSIISYQEDKIYSVLPKDGTGDFTFSGGDGGTRVNQQGYIEQTPANLTTYSEDFSNAAWYKSGAPTMAYNIAIAPNGTLTADSIQANSNGVYQSITQQKSCAPNSTFTFSYYIKKETTKTYFSGTYLYFTGGTFKITYVTFDEVTGAYNIIAGGTVSLTVNVENVGDWWRLSISGTDTGNNTNIDVGIYGTLSQNGTTLSPGIGSARTIWGAMLNQGSTALPYQPTTDRLNYPRITYQNGIGQLMGEPQRTNVLTNSQDLAACLPSQANTTVTADATISPDGTQNADNILFAANGGYRLKTTSIVSGTTYCPSIFVKNNTFAPGEFFTLNLSDGVVGGMNVTIYPATKTITVNSGVWSNVAGRVVPYNNDWFRVELSGTANNTGTGWYEIYTSTAKSVYLWGMQLESLIVSFNPQSVNHNTSYIPTTTSTVTRVRDQYSRSLNSQPTGSIIVKMPNNIVYGGDGTHVYGFFLLGGSSGLGLSLNRSNNTRNRLWTFAASVIYTTTADNLKLGITWDGTYINVWQNGVKVITNYSYALTNVSSFGSSTAIDTVQSLSQIALYSDILSNTQLAELTTVRSGSGGTISYYGPYTIHTFTGSATFTPSFNGQVEVLVVAGGGGGGGSTAGGGGAGGLLYASSYGVAQGTGITVTVGAGGAGSQKSEDGSPNNTNGGNSSFGGLTSFGGGYGFSGRIGGSRVASSGGSGGGAGYYSGNDLGITSPGSGIPGQGNNGGSVSGNSNWGGAGGGGAGAVGSTNASPNNLRTGGIGLPYSISGFSTYFAGGGGGGCYDDGVTYSEGGLGGGGRGGDGGTFIATSGVSNTGGGGGGSGYYQFGPNPSGGNGGSGIVIVRYLT